MPQPLNASLPATESAASAPNRSSLDNVSLRSDAPLYQLDASLDNRVWHQVFPGLATLEALRPTSNCNISRSSSFNSLQAEQIRGSFEPTWSGGGSTHNIDNINHVTTPENSTNLALASQYPIRSLAHAPKPSSGSYAKLYSQRHLSAHDASSHPPPTSARALDSARSLAASITSTEPDTNLSQPLFEPPSLTHTLSPHAKRPPPAGALRASLENSALQQPWRRRCANPLFISRSTSCGGGGASMSVTSSTASITAANTMSTVPGAAAVVEPLRPPLLTAASAATLAAIQAGELNDYNHQRPRRVSMASGYPCPDGKPPAWPSSAHHQLLHHPQHPPHHHNQTPRALSQPSGSNLYQNPIPQPQHPPPAPSSLPPWLSGPCATSTPRTQLRLKPPPGSEALGSQQQQPHQHITAPVAQQSITVAQSGGGGDAGAASEGGAAGPQPQSPSRQETGHRQGSESCQGGDSYAMMHGDEKQPGAMTQQQPHQHEAVNPHEGADWQRAGAEVRQDLEGTIPPSAPLLPPPPKTNGYAVADPVTGDSHCIGAPAVNGGASNGGLSPTSKTASAAPAPAAAVQRSAGGSGGPTGRRRTRSSGSAPAPSAIRTRRQLSAGSGGGRVRVGSGVVRTESIGQAWGSDKGRLRSSTTCGFGGAPGSRARLLTGGTAVRSMQGSADTAAALMRAALASENDSWQLALVIPHQLAEAVLAGGLGVLGLSSGAGGGGEEAGGRGGEGGLTCIQEDAAPVSEELPLPCRTTDMVSGATTSAYRGVSGAAGVTPSGGAGRAVTGRWGSGKAMRSQSTALVTAGRTCEPPADSTAAAPAVHDAAPPPQLGAPAATAVQSHLNSTPSARQGAATMKDAAVGSSPCQQQPPPLPPPPPAFPAAAASLPSTQQPRSADQLRAERGVCLAVQLLAADLTSRLRAATCSSDGTCTVCGFCLAGPAAAAAADDYPNAADLDPTCASISELASLRAEMDALGLLVAAVPAQLSSAAAGGTLASSATRTPRRRSASPTPPRSPYRPGAAGGVGAATAPRSKSLGSCGDWNKVPEEAAAAVLWRASAASALTSLSEALLAAAGAHSTDPTGRPSTHKAASAACGGGGWCCELAEPLAWLALGLGSWAAAAGAGELQSRLEGCGMRLLEAAAGVPQGRDEEMGQQLQPQSQQQQQQQPGKAPEPAMGAGVHEDAVATGVAVVRVTHGVSAGTAAVGYKDGPRSGGAGSMFEAPNRRTSAGSGCIRHQLPPLPPHSHMDANSIIAAAARVSSGGGSGSLPGRQLAAGPPYGLTAPGAGLGAATGLVPRNSLHLSGGSDSSSCLDDSADDGAGSSLTAVAGDSSDAADLPYSGRGAQSQGNISTGSRSGGSREGSSCMYDQNPRGGGHGAGRGVFGGAGGDGGEAVGSSREGGRGSEGGMADSSATFAPYGGSIGNSTARTDFWTTGGLMRGAAGGLVPLDSCRTNYSSGSGTTRTANVRYVSDSISSEESAFGAGGRCSSSTVMSHDGGGGDVYCRDRVLVEMGAGGHGGAAAAGAAAGRHPASHVGDGGLPLTAMRGGDVMDHAQQLRHRDRSLPSGTAGTDKAAVASGAPPLLVSSHPQPSSLPPSSVAPGAAGAENLPPPQPAPSLIPVSEMPAAAAAPRLVTHLDHAAALISRAYRMMPSSLPYSTVLLLAVSPSSAAAAPPPTRSSEGSASTGGGANGTTPAAAAAQADVLLREAARLATEVGRDASTCGSGGAAAAAAQGCGTTHDSVQGAVHSGTAGGPLVIAAAILAARAQLRRGVLALSSHHQQQHNSPPSAKTAAAGGTPASPPTAGPGVALPPPAAGQHPTATSPPPATTAATATAAAAAAATSAEEVLRSILARCGLTTISATVAPSSAQTTARSAVDTDAASCLSDVRTPAAFMRDAPEVPPSTTEEIVLEIAVAGNQHPQQKQQRQQQSTRQVAGASSGGGGSELGPLVVLLAEALGLRGAVREARGHLCGAVRLYEEALELLSQPQISNDPPTTVLLLRAALVAARARCVVRLTALIPFAVAVPSTPSTTGPSPSRAVKQPSRTRTKFGAAAAAAATTSASPTTSTANKKIKIEPVTVAKEPIATTAPIDPWVSPLPIPWYLMDGQQPYTRIQDMADDGAATTSRRTHASGVEEGAPVSSLPLPLPGVVAAPCPRVAAAAAVAVTGLSAEFQKVCTAVARGTSLAAAAVSPAASLGGDMAIAAVTPSACESAAAALVPLAEVAMTLVRLQLLAATSTAPSDSASGVSVRSATTNPFTSPLTPMSRHDRQRLLHDAAALSTSALHWLETAPAAPAAGPSQRPAQLNERIAEAALLAAVCAAVTASPYDNFTCRDGGAGASGGPLASALAAAANEGCTTARTGRNVVVSESESAAVYDERWDLTWEWGKRALAVRQELFGVASQPALEVQALLGAAAGMGMGLWHVAEPLLVSVAALRSEQYGAAHPDTQAVGAAYAALLIRHGRLRTAENFLRRQIPRAISHHRKLLAAAPSTPTTSNSASTPTQPPPTAIARPTSGTIWAPFQRASRGRSATGSSASIAAATTTALAPPPPPPAISALPLLAMQNRLEIAKRAKRLAPSYAGAGAPSSHTGMLSPRSLILPSARTTLPSARTTLPSARTTLLSARTISPQQPAAGVAALASARSRGGSPAALLSKGATAVQQQQPPTRTTVAPAVGLAASGVQHPSAGMDTAVVTAYGSGHSRTDLVAAPQMHQMPLSAPAAAAIAVMQAVAAQTSLRTATPPCQPPAAPASSTTTTATGHSAQTALSPSSAPRAAHASPPQPPPPTSTPLATAATGPSGTSAMHPVTVPVTVPSGNASSPNGSEPLSVEFLLSPSESGVSTQDRTGPRPPPPQGPMEPSHWALEPAPAPAAPSPSTTASTGGVDSRPAVHTTAMLPPLPPPSMMSAASTSTSSPALPVATSTLSPPSQLTKQPTLPEFVAQRPRSGGPLPSMLDPRPSTLLSPTAAPAPIAPDSPAMSWTSVSNTPIRFRSTAGAAPPEQQVGTAAQDCGAGDYGMAAPRAIYPEDLQRSEAFLRLAASRGLLAPLGRRDGVPLFLAGGARGPPPVLEAPPAPLAAAISAAAAAAAARQQLFKRRKQAGMMVSGASMGSGGAVGGSHGWVRHDETLQGVGHGYGSGGGVADETWGAHALWGGAGVGGGAQPYYGWLEGGVEGAVGPGGGAAAVAARALHGRGGAMRRRTAEPCVGRQNNIRSSGDGSGSRRPSRLAPRPHPAAAVGSATATTTATTAALTPAATTDADWSGEWMLARPPIEALIGQQLQQQLAPAAGVRMMEREEGRGRGSGGSGGGAGMMAGAPWPNVVRMEDDWCYTSEGGGGDWDGACIEEEEEGADWRTAGAAPTATGAATAAALRDEETGEVDMEGWWTVEAPMGLAAEAVKLMVAGVTTGRPVSKGTMDRAGGAHIADWFSGECGAEEVAMCGAAAVVRASHGGPPAAATGGAWAQ